MINCDIRTLFHLLNKVTVEFRQNIPQSSQVLMIFFPALTVQKKSFDKIRREIYLIFIAPTFFSRSPHMYKQSEADEQFKIQHAHKENQGHFRLIPITN